MGDNSLPCARDQRFLLPLAWQDWVPEGGLACSSSMRWPRGEYNE